MHLSYRTLTGDEGISHLVLANLLAPLIVHLAGALTRVTAPGGMLVTSGVLENQQPEVVRALEPHGPRAIETRIRDGWVTAFLSRS